jgi:hypothetical protein
MRSPAAIGGAAAIRRMETEGQLQRRSDQTEVRGGAASREEVDGAGGRRQSAGREEPPALLVCLARNVRMEALTQGTDPHFALLSVGCKWRVDARPQGAVCLA